MFDSVTPAEEYMRRWTMSTFDLDNGFSPEKRHDSI